MGERLNHQIDLATYRAASVLLLCAPETPLLFMGQEWAASAPFLYFTDHHPELGRLVTEGRRREFAAFATFADAASRDRIPDPQAEETFLRSRLEWEEREREPHASMLRLHHAVLDLRRREPLLRAASWEGFAVRAGGESALVLARHAPEAGALCVLIQFRGQGTVRLREADLGVAGGQWSVLLDTEDPTLSPDSRPPEIERLSPVPRVRFVRPGALILRLYRGADFTRPKAARPSGRPDRGN
jgi:maltooligosyltrehalose trehalohydrolase